MVRPLARCAAVMALTVVCALSFPTSARAAQALTISGIQTLCFGHMTNGAGTVVIAANGACSSTGSVFLPTVATDSRTAAQFSIVGEPGYAYTITLPSSVLMSGPGADLTIDSFTSFPSGSSVVGESGTGTIGVGATLHMSEGQAIGAYSGSFEITVSYE